MDDSDTSGEAPNRYLNYLREERQFCAVLAHLLMQEGSNLENFVRTLNGMLYRRGVPMEARIPLAGLHASEVYVEYAPLRDQWFELGTDNSAKREFVVALMSRIPTLSDLPRRLPESVPQWNELLAGERGKRIRNDRVYPGQWTLQALARLTSEFALSGAAFRDLCRLKWSFNIKPDLVILPPTGQAICIEAKLESAEDSYPSGTSDCSLFDSIVGPGCRVGQVELQQFLFRYVLQRPAQAVVIEKWPRDRKAASAEEEPIVIAVNWGKVFGRLERKVGSIPFVEHLLLNNRHLASAYAGDRIGDDDAGFIDAEDCYPG